MIRWNSMQLRILLAFQLVRKLLRPNEPVSCWMPHWELKLKQMLFASMQQSLLVIKVKNGRKLLDCALVFVEQIFEVEVFVCLFVFFRRSFICFLRFDKTNLLPGWFRRCAWGAHYLRISWNILADNFWDKFGCYPHPVTGHKLKRFFKDFFSHKKGQFSWWWLLLRWGVDPMDKKHPWRLNLKINPWKRRFLLETHHF